MKNNFDLTNYMKSNKVGAYQQLNEMWYQDINQALGDFNTMKEVEEREPEYNKEMEEGKFQDAIVPIKKTMDSLGYKGEYDPTILEGYIFTKDLGVGVMEITLTSLYDDKEKFTFTAAYFPKINQSQFFGLLKKQVIDYKNGKIVSDDVEHVDLGTGMFSLDEPGVENLIKSMVSKVESKANTKGAEEMDEMAGDNVKSLGAGKMAHANTRVNLGRHRSSDMLDKMSKKDHKTNTVVGAKAAAYKAPHMKEDEFKSFGDPDLTLNDLNNNIVITPFELEKTWKDVYGEDFKTEYSGAHSYLIKNYKNFTIADLVDVWEKMYGEDFLYEYSGIAKWLFSNQGKTSSKDKVAPKMNEDESEKEKAMYANTDPNIADPINQDDDIFAGSEKANWKDNYGNETSEWDTEIAGQTIKGWTAEETQGGAIAWQNPRYPNADIYATPGWEGVDGIALELHDSEDGFMDEPKIQKVVGAGTDLWKTKEGYMALMAKVFTTLEKMLKPSEEMAEDDGTGRQINHDFNDDISKDPSEFEDAIQEDENPFDNIKAGINKITHDGDTNPFNVDNDDMDDEPNDYRFDQLGGDKIKAGIESLMADGFDYREILQFVKDAIASKRNY